MILTVPHMGPITMTAQTLLEGIGQRVILPPPCTKKTLSLGSQYSPEFACLPLKINIGNLIEAYELGADTALMVGGIGPCRIGYYGYVQQDILNEIGIDMEIIILEPPFSHPKDFWLKIQRLRKVSWKKTLKAIYLAWLKTRMLDLLEARALILRPLELNRGAMDYLLDSAKNELKLTGRPDLIKQIKKIYLKRMSEAASKPTPPSLIKIAIVGEIYTVLEPFANQNIEHHLNYLGVQIVRCLYLSSWVNEHLLGGLLKIEGTKNTADFAKPFLNSFVGGHGRETVGSTVQFASAGVDGIIQVAPLTCMPEIVAHSILPKVSNEYQVPILTLYVDEQTGEAGLITRLEAFVDMIRQKKRRMIVNNG
ncbi:MAG: CoA protein activase [Bacillota bacterium]